MKGKKKRGATARAESKPKRKRIQVRYDMPGMYLEWHLAWQDLSAACG